MSENVLKRYIRIGKKPIGCIVAVKGLDGRVGFGYSLCNFAAGDHFSKKEGTKIAIGRAKNGFYINVLDGDTRYYDVVGELHQMAVRASLYFREDLHFVESVDPKVLVEAEYEYDLEVFDFDDEVLV